MQIDSLNSNLIHSTHNSLEASQAKESGLEGIFGKVTEKLKNLNLNDRAVYARDSLKAEKSATDASIGNTDAIRQAFLNTSKNISNSDLKKMEELGFAPKDMDPENFVTVADQIKMQLAKAGVDVSRLGGLDNGAIEAMTGSAAEAAGLQSKVKEVADTDLETKTEDGEEKAITRELSTSALRNAFEDADLPMNDDMMRDLKTALQEAAEILPRIEGGLPKSAANELIRSNEDPTIRNLYRAIFIEAGNGSGFGLKNQPEDKQENIVEAVNRTKLSDEDLIGMDQIDKRILDSRFPITQSTEKEALYLYQNDLPITSDSMALLDKLVRSQGMTDKDAIADAIVAEAAQGRQIEDSYLLTGFSAQDQAREAVEVLTSSDQTSVDKLEAAGLPLNLRNLRLSSQVYMGNVEQSLSTREAAEESSYSKTLLTAQLVMNVDNTARMVRSGLNIETEDLSKLIDKLEEEKPIYSDDEVSLMKETLEKKDTILSAPVAMLGTFSGSSLLESRLQGLSDLAERWTERNSGAHLFSSKLTHLAEKTYEAVGTEVRKDLGDSIQKAFRNIDELLKENGLEITEDNRRAVRILGYNHMEVTEENVLRVRSADQAVRVTLDKLKPARVLEMIREGKNPLHMTMKELSDTADQMDKRKDGNSEEEKMAEFLYRMDKTEGITEEERNSFIGIYRLIHQVNKNDGAAIGKLVMSGREITMENLMESVRIKRAENREYVVDDSQGETILQQRELSITEQIEVAFQKNHLQHAESIITPSKLMAMGGEEAMKPMTPEAFDQALSHETEPVSIEEERLNMIRQEMQDAANAEPIIYRALEEYDMDSTAANLAAMQALVKRAGEVWKNLGKTHRNMDGSLVDVENPDIKAMLEEVMEDYGEACKTPKEMAEAQERLADLAEHAMDSVMTSEDSNVIDLRSMHLLQKQMNICSTMSEEETYHLPIMVADEYGNMTLKIVRGKEDKGLVALVLDTDRLGKVSANLKADQDGVKGTFSAERRSTQELLSEHASVLSDAIAEESGVEPGLTFTWNEEQDYSQIYFEKGEEDDPRSYAKTEAGKVQTTRLYSIARGIIQAVSRLGQDEGFINP